MYTLITRSSEGLVWELSIDVSAAKYNLTIIENLGFNQELYKIGYCIVNSTEYNFQKFFPCLKKLIELTKKVGISNTYHVLFNGKQVGTLIKGTYIKDKNV